jgi:molybdopterin-guanine dinucleotide biosynthesis protein B
VKVIGIAGWSGAGKTTLVIRLLPALIERGLSVSTIKHAHHAFDVDQPGKDSYRHRSAGAREVLISSRHRWALMHEHLEEFETPLPDLLARLTPVDLVLVEGFRDYPHTKIEIYRESLGKPLLASDDPNVVAVASDTAVAGLDVPVLDLDDENAIAEFIIRHQTLTSRVA